jgi:hypothetical protein
MGSSCWIFYTAPFVGALLATGLYKILKWSKYESVVEGQDGDNRHLLIRNKAGDLAGFVEEVDEETAQPHLDRVLEGGAGLEHTGSQDTGGGVLVGLEGGGENTTRKAGDSGDGTLHEERPFAEKPLGKPID